MIYNKLVRDKIPHIIQENGKRCEFRVLDDQEYKASLRAKLQEEMDECLSANENELVSELADLVDFPDFLLLLYKMVGNVWSRISKIFDQIR